MSIQKLTRSILLGLFVLLFATAEIATKVLKHEETQFVVASGIIQDRIESDYSCGTKGRDICYTRYFQIDGQRHNVSLDTFNKFIIGEAVTLTETKYKLMPILAENVSVFFRIVVAGISAVFFFYFLFWALFESDTRSFKEYRKRGPFDFLF